MIAARLARRLAWLLFLPALAGPVSGQTALAGPEDATPREARVRAEITPCLNLRFSPSATAEIIECLEPRQVITLFESREGWSRVRLEDGRQGWVASRFLEVPRIGSSSNPTGTDTADPLPVPIRKPFEAGPGQTGAAGSAETTEQQFGSELDDATAEVATQREQPENAQFSDGELDLQLRSSQAEVERLRSELDRSREIGARLRRDLDNATLPQAQLLEEVERLTVAETELRRELEESRASESRLREQLETAMATAPSTGMPATPEPTTPEPAAEEALPLEPRVTVQAPLAFDPVGTPEPAAIADTDTAPQTVAPDGPFVPVDTDVVSPVDTPAPAVLVEEGSGIEEDTGIAESIGFEESAGVEGSTGAEASAVVEEYSAPDDDTVVEELPVAADLQIVVRSWAGAWSDQRVDDYLTFYSVDFEPTGSRSRPAWAAQRRDRISAPEFITIGVEAIDILPAAAEGETEVRFVQTYESESYKDKVIKRLVFVLENDAWKIRQEEVVEALPSP